MIIPPITDPVYINLGPLLNSYLGIGTPDIGNGAGLYDISVALSRSMLTLKLITTVNLSYLEEKRAGHNHHIEDQRSAFTSVFPKG